VQATAQQQRTKRLGLPQLIRCTWCGHLAAFPAGKCSKPADTRHHVPDADSDRARLPGTGPAPRPGRLRTCRAKGWPRNHQRADRSALV